MQVAPLQQQQRDPEEGVVDVTAAAKERWAQVLEAKNIHPKQRSKEGPKFAENSLFLFDADNVFRKAIIDVVISPWFEYTIFVVLLINCIFMGLADYSHIDSNGELSTKNSARNQIVVYSEYFFIAVYALEMVLKVIAMGLRFGEGTYLKNYWQWLEIVIVALGFARFAPGFPDLSALRIFRLFRPTRTTSVLSGVQRIVISVLSSIPQLFNMLVLLVLVFMIFGIGGLLIFSRPEMYARCRLTPYPVFRNWTVGLPFDEYRCLHENTFNVPASNREWSFETSAWHTPRDCYWPVDEEDQRLCTFGSGQHKCIHDTDKIPESEWRWCGSNYDGLGNPRFTAGELNGKKYSKREFNKHSTFSPEFMWNLNSFSNIGLSFLAGLQAVTLEGWVDVCYMTQDAISGFGGAIYFVLLVILGAWFTVNLLLAVLQEKFEAAKAVYEQTQKQQKAEHDQAAALAGLNAPKSFIMRVQHALTYVKTLPIWDMRAEDCMSGPVLKCYLMIQAPLKRVVTSEAFAKVIIAITLANTVVLALDHYPIKRDFEVTLDLLNFCFTVVFTVEMLAKLLALGVWDYCADVYNRLDGVIVIASLVELGMDPPLIFGGSAQGGAMTAVRLFRVARAVKLVRQWEGMRRVLESLNKSAAELLNFGFLLFLFLYAYALLGMSLFANRMRFDEEGYPVGLDNPDWKHAEVPRSNFDTFEHAFTTAFSVLTGEGWNSVFYDAYKGAGPAPSVLYFFSLLVLGMFMFMSLFLAIVLSSFDLQPDPNMPSLNNYMSKLGQSFRVQSDTGSVSSADTGDDRSKRAKSVQPKETPPNSPEKEVLNPEKTLFIFSDKNPIRVVCAKITSNEKFDMFIFVLIIISSITLAMDNPLDDPKGNLVVSLTYINYVMTSLFVIEMLMKIIATGLVFQDGAYLRDSWNVLDGAVVMLSVISIFISAQPGLKGLRAARALRALRPLRLIKRAEGLKVVVNAMLFSIPTVLNIGVVCLFFFLVVALIGVNSFKGGLRACQDTVALDDPTYTHFLTYPKPWNSMTMEQKGWFGPSSEIRNFSSCTVWPDQACCGAWPNSKSETPTSKQICECWNGDWEYTTNERYDNVFQSMYTFFEMSTKERWVDMMYAAVDHRGIDMQPVRDHNLGWVWFFMLFMLLGAYLMMNLFVGGVLESFNCMRWQAGGNMLLTKQQQIWAKTQLIAMRANPRVRREPRNPTIHRIVTHPYFEKFILFCVIFNTVVMCLQHFGQSSAMSGFIGSANTTFTGIFFIEFVLKFIVLGTKYFADAWNRIDFLVVVTGTTSTTLNYVLGPEAAGVLAVVRVLRVYRFRKLVAGMKGMKQLFRAFVMTLPGLANVAALLFLLFFVYAVVGVQLFANVAYHEEHNEHANFRTFGSAMFLLFRMSTGEDWHVVVHGIAANTGGCENSPSYDSNSCGYREEPGCEPVNGCGSDVIYPYAITFMLFAVLMFLNLLIGVIFEAFEGSGDGTVTVEDILEFTEHWGIYDPKAKRYIPLAMLAEFCRTLPAPLGFKGTSVGDRRIQAIFVMSRNPVTVYAGRTVRFNDVLCVLAENYARRRGVVTDEDVELVAQQVGMHRKKQHKALRDTSGFVYTISQYYAAEKIVAFLRQAIAAKHPEGACAQHLSNPELFESRQRASSDDGMENRSTCADGAEEAARNGIELTALIQDPQGDVSAEEEMRSAAVVTTGHFDDSGPVDQISEASSAVVVRDNTSDAAI